jgi:hypothetical protein
LHTEDTFFLLIWNPDKLIAKILDPRRVKKIGPWDSNAWKIPRVIALIKGRIKVKISVIIPVVDSDPQEQFTLEQES